MVLSTAPGDPGRSLPLEIRRSDPIKTAKARAAKARTVDLDSKEVKDYGKLNTENTDYPE